MRTCSRAIVRAIAAGLLALLVSCGDDPDPRASVRIEGLATEATTLDGPNGSTLVVPAGASADGVTIVLSAPRTRRPAPATTTVVSDQFRLEPEGKVFLQPLELTIPITPSALPAGKTVDDVIVVRAPQGSGADAFVPLPTRREGNAVVAQTEHFSDFLAIVPRDPEAFGSCTNTMCEPNESCESCPADCGLCLPSGDTTPPAVVSVEQPTGAGPIRGDVSFVVRFDEPVMANSIATTTFALAEASVAPLTGTYSVAGDTVTFVPDQLLAGRTYRLVVNGVRDLAGNLMTSAFERSFTTTSGVARSVALPAPGATGIAQNATIGLVFTGAFAATTITAQTAPGPCSGSFQVSWDGFATCVGGALTIAPTEDSFDFVPSGGLPGSTTVEVRATNAARDLSGFSLAPLAGFSFTTTVDAVAPTLVSTDPVNMAVDVPLDAPIVLTFSEPVDPTTAVAPNIVVTGEATGAFVYSVAANVVTLTPSSPLTPDDYYEVQVQNVRDHAGNVLTPGLQIFHFTTESGPHVTSFFPRQGSVGIHPRADLEFAFDRPLDQASLVMQATDSTTCSGTIQLSDGTTCFGGTITFLTSTSIVIRAPSSLPLLGQMTLSFTSGVTSTSGIPFEDPPPAIGFRVSPINDWAYAFRESWTTRGNLSANVDNACDYVDGITRKAFVMTSTRRACAVAWCGSDVGAGTDSSLDWVLLPNTTYVTVSGAHFFTTQSVAPIPPFGTAFANAVGGPSPYYFFGGTWDWMPSSNCANFTDDTLGATGTTIDAASTDPTTAGGFVTSGATSCNTTWPVLCVEQPPITPHPTH